MSSLPHVFVIPPEEEHSQNPPWCCFDADLTSTSSANQADILLDVPFLFHQTDPTPTFDRHQSDPTPTFNHHQSGSTKVVINQPNCSCTSATPKRHRPQDINTSILCDDNRDKVRIIRHIVQDDSDVIEIVKVKRTRDHKSNLFHHLPPSPSNPEPQLKRSKTFRARASSAFRSIKNVSLPRPKQTNTKSHVKELWTSTESMPGIFKGILLPQEDVPPLPTRKFSALFHKQSPLQTHDGILSSSTTTSLPYLKGSDTTPSIADIRPSYEFIERPLTPCAPTYDHNLRRPVSSADFHRPNSPDSMSTTEFKPPVSPQDLHYPATDLRRPVSSQDFRQDVRSSSPTPSTKRSHNRFSVNELHRLFSFAPEPPSSSSPPASTSTSSSSTVSYPDVPYAAVHFVDDDYGKDIEAKYDRSLDQFDAQDADLPPLSPPTDVSFEMRLDSLHFDSLSFDPDDFDVSMSLETTGLTILRR